MKRLVKTLLLCWLMLALPFQVQASVTQLSCAGGQGPGQQQQAAGAKAGHGSHAKSGLRLKQAAKPSSQAAPGAMPADLDHSTCGLCAACCCAQAALPNLPAAPLASSQRDRHPAMLPLSHAGFIPDGLERPPRHRHS